MLHFERNPIQILKNNNYEFWERERIGVKTTLLADS